MYILRIRTAPSATSAGVVALGADSAVLVYRAEQSTTCGGAPVPSPAWATSVYVYRGGRWLNVLYQQTPLAKP